MTVQENTVVKLNYRYLDSQGHPLHRGRSFSLNVLVGRDCLPPFIEKQLMGKSSGEVVKVPISTEVTSSFPTVIVHIDDIPGGIEPYPGLVLSVLDDAGATSPIRIIRIDGDRIYAHPVQGDPGEDAAFVEIKIESIRWASMEEFLEGRAKHVH